MFQIGTHLADGWPIEHPDRSTPVAIIRERTDAELILEALNARRGELDPAGLEAAQAEIAQLTTQKEQLAGELAVAQTRTQELEQQIEQLTAPASDTPAVKTE